MTTPSKDATVKFTSRDIEQLAKAFGCMKTELPGLDYQKFAVSCGFANANSAKASWHTLKKKIDKVAGGNVAISHPDGGEIGKKRKADSAIGADEDGEGEVAATPTAKKRRTPAKPKATPKTVKGEDEGDDDGGDGAEAAVKPEVDEDELAAPAPTPATPKTRKPRTPKAKVQAVAADASDEAGAKPKTASIDGDAAATNATTTAATPKPKGRKAATPAKSKMPAKKTVKAEEADDVDVEVEEDVKEEDEVEVEET